jgi:hypothetical protein
MLLVCSSCHRHVDADVRACPFCGSEAPRVHPAPADEIRIHASLYGGPPVPKGRAALPGLLIAAFGLVLAAVSAAWALFFSIGAHGGSTADLVRYNLSHPLTAIVAYGPLTVSIAVIVIGAVIAVRDR